MAVPMSEPMIVPCLFCTGVDVQATDHFVRLIGWVELPRAADGMPEGRIIARMVMPPETARSLSRDLRRAFAKGSH